MSKSICIIPARGGSKRFPKKNLAKIGGKTLVRGAIDLALESNIFDTVLLSSDDSNILNEAKDLSKKIEIQKRCDDLASDTTTVKDLTISICKSISREYKYVCIILPTAPFTLPSHIKEAFSEFIASKNNDGIVSLTSYEFPPQFSIIFKEKFMFYHILGAIFIIIGISLSNKKSKIN